MSKPAARLGDNHLCPKVEPGPVPHVGGPIVQGSPNVLIGGQPAARLGDMAVCIGPPDKPVSGSATVFINNKPAARMGDSCGHGGAIVTGCPTVLIGDASGGGGSPVVATTSNSHLPAAPESLPEVMERMQRATEKVQECRKAKQMLPKSPFSTADKLNVVQQGLKEKFIVRVIETKYAGDSGFIGKQTNGVSSYWTTTYTQLEYADKDAELITKAVGIDYDPKAEYTLLVIDQEQASVEGDMVSFIPTTENLSAFAQQELKDAFAGKEALIEPAMTPEYSEYYEQVVKTANSHDIDLNDKDDFNDLAADLKFDKNQRSLLQVRHSLNKKIGANEQFLGNGLANDKTANNPETPFGPAKSGYGYGPVETFSYDKNPKTLSNLEQAGIVTRISLA